MVADDMNNNDVVEMRAVRFFREMKDIGFQPSILLLTIVCFFAAYVLWESFNSYTQAMLQNIAGINATLTQNMESDQKFRNTATTILNNHTQELTFILAERRIMGLPVYRDDKGRLFLQTETDLSSPGLFGVGE